jgi:hypothetical protein
VITIQGRKRYRLAPNLKKEVPNLAPGKTARTRHESRIFRVWFVFCSCSLFAPTGGYCISFRLLIICDGHWHHSHAQEVHISCDNKFFNISIVDEIYECHLLGYSFTIKVPPLDFEEELCSSRNQGLTDHEQTSRQEY